MSHVSQTDSIDKPQKLKISKSKVKEIKVKEGKNV